MGPIVAIIAIVEISTNWNQMKGLFWAISGIIIYMFYAAYVSYIVYTILHPFHKG